MPPEEIRDIRPPMLLPGWGWMQWLGLIAVIAVAAMALFWWKKTRRPKSRQEPQKPPRQKALERIEALIKRGLLDKGEVGLYYAELSDIVRWYFEEKFHIRAPEMTTEEFLSSLGANQGIPSAMKDLLAGFMRQCDMVKFARFRPAVEQARVALEQARKVIDYEEPSEAGGP